LPAPRRRADPPSLECWPSNHAGRLACAAAYYDARAPCFASCRPCSDERTPSSSSSPAPTLLRRRRSAPHVHSQGLKLCHFWAGTLGRHIHSAASTERRFHRPAFAAPVLSRCAVVLGQELHPKVKCKRAQGRAVVWSL
jgi:hypothetical protein